MVAIEQEDLCAGESSRTDFLQCLSTIAKYDFIGPVSFHPYRGTFKSGWTEIL